MVARVSPHAPRPSICTAVALVVGCVYRPPPRVSWRLTAWNEGHRNYLRSSLAPYGSVFQSGGGVLTVLLPRVFSKGQHVPKLFPNRSTFGSSKLSKIVPKRSTLHIPKLFILPCVASRVVCPQGICVPSRDLYALKGLICPQGTWARAQVP